MSDVVLTPSQTSGPLFGFCLLFDGCGGEDVPAEGRVRLKGSVVDGTGKGFGFPRGFVEVWHGAEWTRARTDGDGFFQVHLGRPLARTAADGAFLAPHLNVAVFGVGLLKHFLTRVYLPDEEEANRKDAVLEMLPEQDRERLVGRFSDDGSLHFEIVLQGARETPSFGW